MQRFALYALCAAATALAVWLVLRSIEPGASADRAREPSAGAAARIDALADPQLGSESEDLEDVAALEALEPDDAPSRDAIDASARVPSAPRGEGFIDARAPVQPVQPVQVQPIQTGSGGSAPGVVVMQPDEPRVIRPLLDPTLDPSALDPSDATPIEPLPEEPGVLADPEVKSRVLENFPDDPLPPE